MADKGGGCQYIERLDNVYKAGAIGAIAMYTGSDAGLGAVSLIVRSEGETRPPYKSGDFHAVEIIHFDEQFVEQIRNAEGNAFAELEKPGDAYA